MVRHLTLAGVVLAATVGAQPAERTCVAEQLPEWATAAPEARKALLDRCPGPPAPAPEPAVLRGYAMSSAGFIESLPSAGQANFREFHCCSTSPWVTGVGQRSIPDFLVPVLIDLELGLVIHERLRVAVEGVPLFQLMGHVGLDLGHVLQTGPDHFGTFTLWLGGGYQRLVFIANTPKLDGAVASLRVTYEHKWGHLLLRPEVFVRLQFVSEYDLDNDGEGSSYAFPAVVPTFQLGLKLAFGGSFPR
jgi:hypothetical protein